jgi:preprotein translocase subunit SecD
MHLMLEVETEKALSNTIDRTVSDLSELLFNERIPVDKIERVGSDKLTLELLNTSYQDKLNKLLKDRFSNLDKLRYEEKEGIALYTLGLRKEDTEYLRRFAVDQGLETIRNRIDEFGVSEPTIQKQGEDRILIQLPGIKDPKRALDLIGKTALLEFKVVNDDHDVNRCLPTRKSSIQNGRTGKPARQPGSPFW